MNRLDAEKKYNENEISVEYSNKHLKTNLEITNQKDEQNTNDNSIKKSSNPSIHNSESSIEDNHENDLNDAKNTVSSSLSKSTIESAPSSHHYSNNKNKASKNKKQLLQPQTQKQQRRPSIFDYVNLNEKITNMETEFIDRGDEKTKSNISSTGDRSPQIPLLHISYATVDKEGTFYIFLCKFEYIEN